MEMVDGITLPFIIFLSKRQYYLKKIIDYNEDQGAKREQQARNYSTTITNSNTILRP